MNNFEVIIGIENHVELKTKTKMFAPSLVSYGSEPNTDICEVDLGYPGALPTVNKEGVKLAIIACKALNMEIESHLVFDRKNYFYPDLVKGFQITQQYQPIGRNGFIEIDVCGGLKKRIEIERLHIEEDTAKQIHKENLTYLDYNRSGVGLIEIVSKPLIRSANEAVEYINSLREILLFLGVSDVKMNEGSLRCDINISLRPYGFSGFGVKVEIKNLNSINNVKKAIEYEIKRQTELILSGNKVQQETRRFDENKQETVLMRVKTDAVDYKYFREPNILPIMLDKKWIDEVINSSLELASKKRKRYVENYNLKIEDVNYILSSLELTNFFESSLELGCNPTRLLNYLITDIKALLNKENITIDKSKLTPINMYEIMKLSDEGIISSKHIKILLPLVFENDKSVNQLVEENNLKLINDETTIINLLTPIIESNNKMILENYETRFERIEKTIMGQLMKETNGNINPDRAANLIKIMVKKIIK